VVAFITPFYGSVVAGNASEFADRGSGVDGGIFTACPVGSTARSRHEFRNAWKREKVLPSIQSLRVADGGMAYPLRRKVFNDNEEAILG